MAASFQTPYDIVNRGLQMLGVPRISTFSDTSRQAKEASFAYDKLRRAELRRFVWTFATRRAVLRKITATTKKLTFAAWSSATTYAAGDIATYGGLTYISPAGSNTNNTPGLTTSWQAYFGPLYADTWSSAVAYLPGDMVIASSVVYLAIAASTNQTPPNATYWVAPAGAGTSSIVNLSPIGYKPDGSAQRNIYPLPNNFLRLAAQDPKVAAVARLSVSGGILYNDWEIENGYIFSADQTDPLVLRFVGDVADVTSMEDMFCEALGCRVGLALNETLTQRPDLANLILGEYARFLREAQAISAIESGSTEADIAASIAVAGGGQPQAGQAPQGR